MPGGGGSSSDPPQRPLVYSGESPPSDSERMPGEGGSSSDLPRRPLVYSGRSPPSDSDARNLSATAAILFLGTQRKTWKHFKEKKYFCKTQTEVIYSTEENTAICSRDR
ncbi:hypothetical protein Y1Q_0019347 [Alligator mississippiensis]|uniref:Uncharacterized protein n=1 Tax=Alligator mississippiensis TaxID=8496 RepID=A0A151MQW6_ALLMI|nr:hypothetical protein Y1Q_0019347 [Alligator mississippiensis]